MRARDRLLAALLLAAVTAVVFLPAADGGFSALDDPDYVTDNAVVLAGLTWDGVRRAFTETRASNWHPLTWVSHMLDVDLFGLDARGHHAVNVLFHALNAGLLLLLLSGATGMLGRSLSAAALFALHPLRVESVAWVAERKDVLAGCLTLMAMLAHCRYARRPGRLRHAAVVGLAVLAMLAKPSAVALPLLLLVLDWWPLGRLGPHAGPAATGGPSVRAVLGEKVPLAAAAAITTGAAFLAQGAAGSMMSFATLSVPWRLANAAVALAVYPAKALWPATLSVIYLHPGPMVPLAAVAVAVLLLAVGALAAWRLARAKPWLAAGGAWYLAAVLPMLGLVQVGWQSMADRYTYLPLVGLVLAAVWLAAEAVRGRRAAARALAICAALVVVVFAGATRARIAAWRTDEALFGQAVAATGRHWYPVYMLGTALRRDGRPQESLALFEEVVRRMPAFLPAYWGLGRALLDLGRGDEALAAYEAAARQDPGSAEARERLGDAALLVRGGLPPRGGPP
ncbi:MAG TPA: tetratricopeptide repeat protein [bacterium]